MSDWLPGAKVVDLHPGIGNGPFSDCYGVVLHVNDAENGTPDWFWGNGNSEQVCPNFQVKKDGSILQLLPLGWQSWCQADGNYHYASIETAGVPSEPLTDAQLDSCAKILAAYHTQFGTPLQTADSPGVRGFGWHGMGGTAWGGHPGCPGDIRKAQRADIIKRAKALLAPPKEVTLSDLSDADVQRIAAAVWAFPLDRMAYDGTVGKHSAGVRLTAADIHAAMSAKPDVAPPAVPSKK